MGALTGAANLFFIYKFLRILTTNWEDTDAFKLGIIDEKGKILKKKNKLKSKEEKESYTIMHRLVWKLKRLLEKISFGKSRLASYAAALWLIKEEKNVNITDEELQESFLSFLETDWENNALILKENYEGDMDKKSYNNLKEGFKDLPPHLQKSLKQYSKKQKRLEKEFGLKVKTFAYNPKTGKPDIEIEEKAPPGWEGTVKAMKKKKNIDNPWALAWYMKNKGAKPNIPEEVELKEGAVLEIKDVDKWTHEIYKGIKAGWKSVSKSTLGGDENVAILIKLTLEPEKEWPHKILHNATFGMIRIATDGTMEMFASDRRVKNMRKKRIKSAKDVVKNINTWIKKVDEEFVATRMPMEAPFRLEESRSRKDELKYQKALSDFKKKGGKIKKQKPGRTFKSFFKQKGPKKAPRNEEIEEKKSSTGYELYHKTFSDAMQHAYDYAKKKGHIVDPKEIDDKVATGPRKPSKGKTNRYSLKAGRKRVEIQVANLDNKRYELNMYIEGVVIESTKEYAKSLEKIAKDRQLSMLSKKERQTLLKIAALLDKERKEEVELDEDRGDDEHRELVQFKARWLMKQALKSGKGYNQAWWNKQARIAGFEKGADAAKVLMTIINTKKEEVEDMAGEWGTDKLTNTFKNDTPGQGLDEKWEVGVVYHQDFGGGEISYFRADSLLKNKRWKGMGVDEYSGKQKKPRNITADEKVQGWKITPKNKIPKGLKEDVKLTKFGKFITEGRPAGKIRDDENTATNIERQKLVDSQEKNYTLKDIESIARKHKVRLNPVEPPMKFGPEWTIITDRGISLIYDKRKNSTEVTGWRIDKKKLRQYKDKYENEETRIQDVTAGKGRGVLDLRGFESAFEVIGEQLIEDVAANATGAAVVGTGDDPTVWRKKKRKNAKVETEEFGGKKVFVVSPERYWDSRMGKSRYNRYEKYVGNDKLGETIRQYGITNPNSPIILKNSETGAMLYLKYGK